MSNDKWKISFCLLSTQPLTLLLLGALLRRQARANFSQRVVAVFHYGAGQVISIDGSRFKQDCRHLLKAIVDGLCRREAFATRQLYGRVHRPIGKWLDR